VSVGDHNRKGGAETAALGVTEGKSKITGKTERCEPARLPMVVIESEELEMDHIWLQGAGKVSGREGEGHAQQRKWAVAVMIPNPQLECLCSICTTARPKRLLSLKNLQTINLQEKSLPIAFVCLFQETGFVQ
jgi:hypothetical protein